MCLAGITTTKIYYQTSFVIIYSNKNGSLVLAGIIKLYLFLHFQEDPNYPDEGYWVKPHFRSSISYNQDTVIVNLINKKPVEESFLEAVEYDFDIKHSLNLNAILNDFILDRSLSYLAGSKPLVVDNSVANTYTFSTLNDLKVKLNKKELANSTKIESAGFQTETVYESSNAYYLVQVKETKSGNVKRDEDGNIVDVEGFLPDVKLNIQVFSKRFSKFNAAEYMTSEQKRKLESDKNTQDLIDKTLNQ